MADTPAHAHAELQGRRVYYSGPRPGKTYYTKDKWVWAVTPEFAEKFCMPPEFVSTELKGAEAVAYKLVQDQDEERCGWGGNAEVCGKRTEHRFEIYYRNDTIPKVRDVPYFHAAHLPSTMLITESEKGFQTKLKSVKTKPRVGALGPFDSQQFGLQAVANGRIAWSLGTLGPEIYYEDILTLNGIAVTAGQVLASASLSSLSFMPAPDANGATYASFNFSVKDQSGAFDPSPNTLSFNVTAVNDAPRRGSIGQLTTLSFSGQLDASDDPNPYRNGRYGDAYTPVSFADGASMTIALNAQFDAYLQVVRNGSVLIYNDDGGGNLNSLINYTYRSGDVIYATSYDASATGAYSLSVTAASRQVTTEALSTAEDVAASITSLMLPITDPEQSPSQLTYTIEGAATSRGVLSRDGIAMDLGSRFTQADVDRGAIQYTPNVNVSNRPANTVLDEVGDQSLISSSRSWACMGSNALGSNEPPHH